MPRYHLGATIEFLLDAKTLLGLAMPPDESVPLENLTPTELHQRALADRQKRATEERMRVRSMDPNRPWVDYVVTSEQSGRSYRVAVRGLTDVPSADNPAFCTCPDFRTNRLGTCKHILHVQAKIENRAYQFFHQHHVVDDRGKTLGNQRLDQLREKLRPVLLRRTRSEVAKQLAARTDELIRCEATAEQLKIHDANMRVVSQICAKKFMTEMDWLRLQKCLLMTRMVCDSTFLVDQQEAE